MVEETPKRIVDNPTTKELTKLLPLVKLMSALSNAADMVGIKSGELKDLGSRAADVLSLVEVLDLPDRFNAAFASKGWVATSSMSLDMMRDALESHDAGELEKAEEKIQEWFTEETIRRFAIARSKHFDATVGRSMKRSD